MAGREANDYGRPTFVDFDDTILEKFLEAETEFWLQRSSGISNGLIGGGGIPMGSDSTAIEDVGETLARHGKVLQEIHTYFQKLLPCRYLMILATQMEPDQFQVVEHNDRIPYTGTPAIVISYKESDKLLHPMELEIYRCALLAAQYPVLAPSQSSLQGTTKLTTHPVDDSDPHYMPCEPQPSHEEPRLTPNSEECMLYDKDPISPTSVFPIDSDVLTDLVRKAFCLTQRRHTIYYKMFNENCIKNDPAKALFKEMSELLIILKSGCHPFFQPNLFHDRDDYCRWLEAETSEIEKIIGQQELLVQSSVTQSLSIIPLNFKDKHVWYRSLLAKLYKQENSNSRINIASNEAIPNKPLSPEATRLLNEFGERYRIGNLYRRVALLDYLARNFETKEWYCKYVMSVVESILQCVTSGRCCVIREEVKMFKNAMVYVHAHVEHSLTRINRVFPKNTPDGGLRSVIGVLSVLVMVDQDKVFGDHKGKSVKHYLKKYAKEEMCTSYERQKIIIADQLKLRVFGQQATPQMINLMILNISEQLRNYRMYFKKEFIGYFDIVEMAVETFYSLLMEDVHELCDTHPVNRQHKNIDYPMIALAFRLSSFDRDPAWVNYLSLEKQTWRQPFLKHSLSWINSLHYKLQDFVLKALRQDSWKGTTTGENNTDHSRTEPLVQRQERTRSMGIAAKPAVHASVRRTAFDRPSYSFTPSYNSAFDQVGQRGGTVNERETSNGIARGSPTTSEIICQQRSDTLGKTAPQKNENLFTSQLLEATTSDQRMKRCNVAKCGGDTEKNDSEATKTKVTSSSKNLRRKADLVSLPRYLNESSTASSHSFYSAYGSVDSDSSPGSSEYSDAKSHFSGLEDAKSSDENDDTDETARVDNRSIPVSSSLVDLIGGINRVVAVVSHFGQLLCPKQPTTTHDSLRLSPEGLSEMKKQLEAGRANMAKKLSDMVGSLGVMYGYFVICAESCGITNDTLERIIGRRCLTRLLSQLMENDARLCRHNAARTERCNTVDSQGNFVQSCPAMYRVEGSATQSEKVVKEMCIRINNVRTMKNVLAALTKTTVQAVLDPGIRPDVAHDVMFVSEVPNVSSRCHEDGPSVSPASVELGEANSVIDQNSMTKAIRELQEIEEGLVGIMVYRANAVLKQLLQLLLTLNLRTFNTRKRLQPVLNATKRTIHTLSSNLYRDCYVAVLHELWLAIVKDFEDEVAKLVYLNGTARGQANVLLDAVSYFIEIFRAEGDLISLSFVSSSIESVLESLNLYALPTNRLIEMFEAVQMRNENASRMADSVSVRYRYQRPSDVLIEKIRIELHSERAYFSGRRFVECVSDQIRYEGNLRLGICGVPGASDEVNAVTLGQYLMDKEIISFYGKVVLHPSEDSDEDNDLEEELRNYRRPGSVLLIPGIKGPKEYLNDIPAFKSSSEINSCLDSRSSKGTIVYEDDGQSSSFSNSEKILYKFESTDLEDSFHFANREYQVMIADHGRHDDVIRVLFTRRNIDQEANAFLMNLRPNDVLQDLYDQYELRNSSLMNCCKYRAAPA